MLVLRSEPTTMTPAFATVVLDVDSLISGIDGMDWLAQRRGDIVARKVASLAADGSRGVLALDAVYGARLAAIRPRRADVDALSLAYVAALPPGSADAIARIRRTGAQVALVSGGLRHALVRLAFHLSVDLADLHAVDIHFDAIGAYTDFDRHSLLTTPDGKQTVVRSLSLASPSIVIESFDQLAALVP